MSAATTDSTDWNFNVIPVSESSYDVFFDWQDRERRVCLDVKAKSQDDAIAQVLTQPNYLQASLFAGEIEG